MNQEMQNGPRADIPGGGFDQIDADAVCEECGTVNEEGTLLCKICGQNLRDQRARRLSAATGGPETFEQGVNRVRLLTGLIVVLGLLTIVLLAMNIPNIEASWVQRLAAESGSDSVGLWSGPNSVVFDELRREIDEYPTSRSRMQEALDNPVDDRSYNGRYILVPPGRLTVDRVIGEANLSRRGGRVLFVARLRNIPVDIRGYAELDQVGEDGERRAIAQRSVGILVDDEQYTGSGLTQKLEGGGHRIAAFSDYLGSETNHDILAFRVR